MTVIKDFQFMKKLAWLVILLIPTWAAGQLKVGEFDLSKTDVEYVQLSGFDHIDFAFKEIVSILQVNTMLLKIYLLLIARSGLLSSIFFSASWSSLFFFCLTISVSV